MLRTRTLAPALSAVGALLLFAGLAFAQWNNGPGAGGPGMGGGENPGMNPIVIGTVTAIDAASITVTTESGETKTVTLTPNTSFVKEHSADRSALAMGGTVFVLGEAAGQDSVNARVVRILAQSNGMHGPHGPMGQTGGPIIGTIVSLDPLKIQQSSGTTTAKLNEGTLIFKEETAAASDVVKGMKVRIIAPPRPGSDSREARKVILSDENGPARQQAPVSMNLLPDLSGRSDSPFFFRNLARQGALLQCGA